jgi:hypothetical protein
MWRKTVPITSLLNQAVPDLSCLLMISVPA